MDDFLHAHEIDPNFFQVGGRLWPISVRDQMVRAQFLVDRLTVRLRSEWEGRCPSILVVGRGAAGITAAIRAAQLGARVTLVGKEKYEFKLQRNCNSRWGRSYYLRLAA